MQTIEQPSAAGLSAVGVEEDRLPVPPNNRFILAHPPGRYEYKDGQWLPIVKPLHLMPGCNGIRRGAGGWSNYFGQLVRDGWIIIDPLPPGGVLVSGDGGTIEETPGYMIPWPAIGGGYKGTHFAMVWSAPTVVGRGRSANVMWDFDEAGFDAWRAKLLESGVIPKPRPGDVSQQIIIQRKRSERHMRGAHDGAPHVQARVEDETSRLKGMEQSAAALEAPKPKKRRKSTKRPAPASV